MHISSQFYITSHFKDIEQLINEGICVIPTGAGKVPIIQWTKTARPFTAIEFFDLLDKKNAEGVAVRTGMISGGLICIDIDTKHYAGIDAVLFTSIREIYPTIWDKLRLERTPSGGYHALYRYPAEEVKSCNLVSRMATEEELATNPKQKTICFIELKAESMLSQSFPSNGYVREREPKGGLQVLSVEEHSSLLTLLRSFDETIKIEVPKAKKSDVEYYETGMNPYQHFDSSFEAEMLLEGIGWTIFSRKGKFVYYQKPGRKNKDIDASFNTEKRLYKIFTSGTELQPKSFSPSRFLGHTQYNDDMVACYHHLVHQGYGRLKPRVEESIIRKAIASGSAKLPDNVSEEGLRFFEQEKERTLEKYPYGVFWEEDEKASGDLSYSINRERLYFVAACLGFRLLKDGTICKVHDNGWTIERCEDRMLFDACKAYIKESGEEERVGEEIKNCYESFLQKSGKFTISRLQPLDYGRILRSTKEISYKAYLNGYIVVDRDGFELVSYEGLDRYIWAHQIQQREFDPEAIENPASVLKDSLYYRFLEKCVGLSEHAYKCIGYYAHDFKSTMTSYIVVLSEQCEDAKKGGGSGKNVFTNLLQYTTSLLNKPGKNVKFDDTLLRTWNGQRVLSLNDLDKKFDFLGLKELSSGEGEVGKKFMQEVVISNQEMPKLICNTNFSFDPSLPGLKRRLIALEFSNFFTVKGGVDVYFSKDFPADPASSHDWTSLDWLGYDLFMMIAIQKFISGGCKLEAPKMTDGGWIKQFEQRFFKSTYQFIRENIAGWLSIGEVRISEVFNKQYELFCRENIIDKHYMLSSTRMNEALQDYCDFHEIEFTKNKNLGRDSMSHVQINAKVFMRKSGYEEKLRNAEVLREELQPDQKEDLPF